MASRIALVLTACALLVGCADDESVGEPPPCTGACLAGLPRDMPCPPGEWLREADGLCIPAGIPPDGCSEGFEHDGDRGCEPVLPTEACPDGLMAVPGETSCREVAPCVSGWGGIPVEPDTEYVDASYTGGSSNGSPAAPWTSIQAAIDAAPAGAIVAVAAGSYLEEVRIQGKPVRLWGVCPALVDLVAPGGAFAALDIRDGANGTEVRRMGISGQSFGVALSGSEDVRIEESRIHDNGHRGVNVQDDLGSTSLVVARTLIEKNHEYALFAWASEVTVETTVARDTLPYSANFGPELGGLGIAAQIDPETGVRASLTVRGTLIERNLEVGVFVSGSDATVEASVVRDTAPNAQGIGGRGISVQDQQDIGARSNLHLLGSLLERNSETALFIGGSDATVDAMVFRDTLTDTQGYGGAGINVQIDAVTGARSNVAVQRSLLLRNSEIGMAVIASDVTVDATVVSDTLFNGHGLGGRGIEVSDNPEAGERASVVVQRSLLERNHDVGVLVLGSDTVLEATVVRDTMPDTTGLFGRAVQVQASIEQHNAGAATLRASLFDHNHEASVMLFGLATAQVEGCLVRDTVSGDGFLGDGIAAWSYEGSASATIVATRIEKSERAAVSSFGANVALEGSVLACQGFDLSTETWAGQASVLEDRGGNLCGCPEPNTPCLAESHALEPPQPAGPL